MGSHLRDGSTVGLQPSYIVYAYTRINYDVFSYILYSNEVQPTYIVLGTLRSRTIYYADNLRDMSDRQ